MHVLIWGSACESHLKNVQIEQNHIIVITLGLVFHATLYGENTYSALPLLNVLTVLHYVYFSSPTSGIKSGSPLSSITTLVTPVMFTHITLDMRQKETSIKHVLALMLD